LPPEPATLKVCRGGVSVIAMWVPVVGTTTTRHRFARPEPAAPDFSLLRNLKRAVDFDTQVSGRAFKRAMAEQQLHCIDMLVKWRS
jgi:hypothetical protein